MAEVLTPQQHEAVYNRGGRLLVSAAAGSGKTKVLVDRLLSYLQDPIDPANLDDFLIITYTKAAAAELRVKIAAKLSQLIAQQPDDRHLQHQMQLLYLAKISTVHSFCADILREYVHMIDIPSDFRVADENECLELRQMCIDKVLEQAYAQAQQDPDFCAFVDTQGLARDDRMVAQMLLKVYDSACCHKDIQGWLDSCVQNTQLSDITDAAKTVWGAYLVEDLHSYLDMQISAVSQCVQLALSANGMAKVAAVLSDTLSQLQQLRNCTTWDEIVSCRQIDYGRLTFPRKDCDPYIAASIKAVRDACKKNLGKKLVSFNDFSSDVLTDLMSSAAAIRGMVSLVKRFKEAYEKAKRSRRVLDFSDLEQRTLDLLLGKSRNAPTMVADEIAQRFREIMVDEYQDSNEVQDAIFMVLTRQRQNCFMVGDVKQSIYQFRLADPKIFLDKYHDYRSADEAKPNEGRKVLLTQNFRSGGAVLQAVNNVFYNCMSSNIGGLDYDGSEALVEGIPHQPLGEPEVEFWAMDVVDSTYEEEAAFVAKRIKELTNGNHFVREGELLRPIRIDDVAILLRSPGSSGSHYVSALASYGIPCASAGSDDLLQRQEIRVLRSLLQVISNPRQDIPLIAVLTSPLFCFTADDLAAFRSVDRKGSVYDALFASDLPKAADFLSTLSVLRKTARLKSLAQLVQQIFSMTRMDTLYQAMPDGDVCGENLMAFYTLAADFESGGHKDLERFLQHLDALESTGAVKAGERSTAGAVTLTSIHKSKGLEYPVVIVAGLSKVFNRKSVQEQILCDQQMGIGMCAVNPVQRVRYPTVAKRAIALKTIKDSLSEEMRVLYVALTRARDRLIMTYAAKNIEKDISDIVNRMDIGHKELLVGDVASAGEWVLMSALRRTEAGELFALGGRPASTFTADHPWLIRKVSEDPVDECGIMEQEQKALPQEYLQKLREAIDFQYPYAAATKAPSKQTATQRKGRDLDEEAAEHTHRPTTDWRKNAFRSRGKSAADYGTAMHALLQHIRFDSCSDEPSVKLELQRLIQCGFLKTEYAGLIDCGKLVRFFKTDLGKKLCSGEVLREFKFSILDDGIHYDSCLQDEKILLQGVVDCALVEQDGITVVDFKTDRVTRETVTARAQHYKPQVDVYAHALERIYQLPVKQKLLYFFETEQIVAL